jgi:hypothetical protein
MYKNFKNKETIKSYSDFCNWLDENDLNCEYETREITNDRIVIFKKNGDMINNDMHSYMTYNPPKSWNILKTSIEKIINAK